MKCTEPKNVHFNHLKRTVQWHRAIRPRNWFIFPNLTQAPLISSSPLLVTSIPLPVAVNATLLGVSYEGNRTTRVPRCPTSFTSHGVFGAHPCRSACQNCVILSGDVTADSHTACTPQAVLPGRAQAAGATGKPFPRLTVWCEQ